MSAVAGHAVRGFELEEVDEIRDQESDDALVIAAQTNQYDFAALYQRSVDPVFRFCYRRLGNRAIAEDATSATFERAIKAFPRFKTGSFRAWLFTIARNTVIDVQRSHREKQPLSDAWTVADNRPGPEEVSIESADSAWIRDLLANLNDDQRQIVELRLAGLTDAEIGQVLGRSRGSVRTAQYRALQRLRSMLGSDSYQNWNEKGNGHATRRT